MRRVGERAEEASGRQVGGRSPLTRASPSPQRLLPAGGPCQSVPPPPSQHLQPAADQMFHRVRKCKGGRGRGGKKWSGALGGGVGAGPGQSHPPLHPPSVQKLCAYVLGPTPPLGKAQLTYTYSHSLEAISTSIEIRVAWSVCPWYSGGFVFGAATV